MTPAQILDYSMPALLVACSVAGGLCFLLQVVGDRRRGDDE